MMILGFIVMVGLIVFIAYKYESWKWNRGKCRCGRWWSLLNKGKAERTYVCANNHKIVIRLPVDRGYYG